MIPSQRGVEMNEAEQRAGRPIPQGRLSDCKRCVFRQGSNPVIEPSTPILMKGQGSCRPRAKSPSCMRTSRSRSGTLICMPSPRKSAAAWILCSGARRHCSIFFITSPFWMWRKAAGRGTDVQPDPAPSCQSARSGSGWCRRYISECALAPGCRSYAGGSGRFRNHYILAPPCRRDGRNRLHGDHAWRLQVGSA